MTSRICASGPRKLCLLLIYSALARGSTQESYRHVAYPESITGAGLKCSQLEVRHHYGWTNYSKAKMVVTTVHERDNHSRGSNTFLESKRWGPYYWDTGHA